MSTSDRRSFRIVSVSKDDGIDFEKGVYHGKLPSQAALKAFNRYCRNGELTHCVRRFTIEEFTRGKPKKQFHYVGTRKKLTKPIEVERNGVVYKIHYKSTVHKAK